MGSYTSQSKPSSYKIANNSKEVKLNLFPINPHMDNKSLQYPDPTIKLEELLMKFSKIRINLLISTTTSTTWR